VSSVEATWNTAAILDPPATAPPSIPKEPSVFTSEILWELHDQFLRCFEAPDHCDTTRFALPGSPAHSDLEPLFAKYRSSGIRIRPRHTPVVRHVRQLRSLGNEAVVQWCWVDDLVLVDESSFRGTAVIIDDSALTLAETWTLTGADGLWRLQHRQSSILDRDGSSQCS
jgi:hypothetical protein